MPNNGKFGSQLSIIKLDMLLSEFGANMMIGVLKIDVGGFEE